MSKRPEEIEPEVSSSKSLSDQWASFSSGLTRQQQEELNLQALATGHNRHSNIVQNHNWQQYQNTVPPYPHSHPPPRPPPQQYHQHAAAHPYEHRRKERDNNRDRDRDVDRQRDHRLTKDPNPPRPPPMPHPPPPQTNSDLRRPPPPPPPTPQPPSQQIPKPSYHCVSCDKPFPSLLTFNAHKTAHKRCPFCDFESLAKQLSEHVKEIHPDAPDVSSKDFKMINDVACTFSISGECSQGDRCNNPPHNPSKIVQEDPYRLKKKRKPVPGTEKYQSVPAKEKVHNPTSFKSCSFFMAGKCERGNSCPFQHSVPTADPITTMFKKAPEKEKIDPLADLDPNELILLEAINIICQDLIK